MVASLSDGFTMAEGVSSGVKLALPRMEPEHRTKCVTYAEEYSAPAKSGAKVHMTSRLWRRLALSGSFLSGTTFANGFYEVNTRMDKNSLFPFTGFIN